MNIEKKTKLKSKVRKNQREKTIINFKKNQK